MTLTLTLSRHILGSRTLYAVSDSTGTRGIYTDLDVAMVALEAIIAGAVGTVSSRATATELACPLPDLDATLVTL